MDWTDNYRESLSKSPDLKEAVDALSSIVNLWVAFATMEINLRQFKRAVQIYDDALNDPIVNRSAEIYLHYVEYCKTRSKLSNAQKVFIRGLSAGLSQGEADKIWTNFLPFIQSQGSQDLTLPDLYEAVRKEAGIDTLTPPGEEAILATSTPAPAISPITTNGGAIDSTKITTDIKSENEIRVADSSLNSSHTIIDNQNHNEKNISSDSKIDKNGVTSMDVVEVSQHIPLHSNHVVESESKTGESELFSNIHTSSSSQQIENTKHSMKFEQNISSNTLKIEIGTSQVIKNQVTISSPSRVVNDSLKNIESLVTSSAIVKDENAMVIDELSPSTTTYTESSPPVTITGHGDDLDSVVGITPELLIRMYSSRPPMLFTAPNANPTARGISTLKSDEISELESFLGNISLKSLQYGYVGAPVIPIVETTSNIIKNDNLSNAIVVNNDITNKSTAILKLELIESLWTAQSLKERHFDAWFTDLKMTHGKEVTTMLII